MNLIYHDGLKLTTNNIWKTYFGQHFYGTVLKCFFLSPANRRFTVFWWKINRTIITRSLHFPPVYLSIFRNNSWGSFHTTPLQFSNIDEIIFCNKKDWDLIFTLYFPLSIYRNKKYNNRSGKGCLQGSWWYAPGICVFRDTGKFY